MIFFNNNVKYVLHRGDFMETLGELLKRLRGKESLRDASKKIGISHTYLDTIEKGFDKRTGKNIHPTPETLKLIAKAYNYDYEELMIKAGYLNAKSTSIEPSSSQNTDEEEFQAFINDPELQVWYKELPKSDEEELRKLRMIWEMIKNEKK